MDGKPSPISKTERAYHRAYSKAYGPAHRDKINAYQREYRRTHPREEERKRYYQRHREEMLAYYREWCAANPGKMKAGQQHWKDEHREELREYDRTHPKPPGYHIPYAMAYKARKRGARVGDVDLTAVAARAGMVCAICGEPVTPETLSFDHIIPLVRGGAHTTANLQVAHRVCNSRKGARLP
jgi:5-methylcytosine-specific restriction endonuclease McrA